MTTITIHPEQDCYTNCNDPDKTGNQLNTLSTIIDHLQIGADLYNTGTAYHGMCYSFILLNLAGIPSSATITAVNLYLNFHFVRGDYVPVPFVVRKIADITWTETITWNTQPTVGLDDIGSYDLDGSIGPQLAVVSLDPTAFQDSLVDGKIALCVLASDEPMSGVDSPSGTFQDYDYNSPIQDPRYPYVEIEYTTSSGLRLLASLGCGV